ncbi:MAG: PEP-CTERM sorting domain-containing protein [Stigonema ocellatum SAG 48.90 = DSM 106950]|nr:PEP-CTERM sorting domain-containing protein [Stigonema ocellatum SAG 48.90 = DSM 106950]
MKSLLIKSAIASGVVLSLATFTRPAMADDTFGISIRSAGEQSADTSNLDNAQVENFDGLTQGYSASGFDWKASDGHTIIGTYTNTLIENADQYGGANGGGQYFDVDTKRSNDNNQTNNQTVSTLKLNSPQKYFGLWWSAGDANNVLTFLSNGKVVETMTTAQVVDYIATLANKSDYYGNPNSTNHTADNTEPFAFINFYDLSGTFNEVQFTNVGKTGFESDNHTVATGFKRVTGNVVVPEPSSVLGVFVIGFVGATSVLTRRAKKKSVLQLSSVDA